MPLFHVTIDASVEEHFKYDGYVEAENQVAALEQAREEFYYDVSPYSVGCEEPSENGFSVEIDT